MIGTRRARWWCVGVMTPVVIVGLLAMHGLSDAGPATGRANHGAHAMTSSGGHRMPTKSSHDHVHDAVVCVWLLVAGFALLALRRGIDRMLAAVCSAMQRIAAQGRAVMRAPPTAVRLSLVGVSLR